MGRQSRRRHAALHRDSRTPESHGHSGHEHDSSHTPWSCRGLTGVEGAGSIPCAVGVALVDCVRPGALAAEEYPTKPIRRWTPYSPGGGTDILVRLIGPQVSEALGATIIVDNRPDRGRHPGRRNAGTRGPRQLYADHGLGQLRRQPGGAQPAV